MRWILFSLLFIAGCNESPKEPPPARTISIPDSLSAAIQKYPDSSILREELIQYYRDKFNYRAALDETLLAQKRDSNNPRWYDIEAVLHFENADTLRSIRAFEKAISIYPSPEYLIPLGTIYAQTKNIKALAVAEMLATSSLARSEKEAFFIRGLYYSYSGDKQKAIREFDKALAVTFTYMDAYREKAIALYDLGKYNEALQVLDKAVTLQNNFDEGHYFRGRVLEKLGRISEAIEAYRFALTYDPEYVEAREAFDRLNSKK